MEQVELNTINTITQFAYRICTHPMRSQEIGWIPYTSLYAPKTFGFDWGNDSKLYDNLNGLLEDHGRETIDSRTPLVTLERRMIDSDGQLGITIVKSLLFRFPDAVIPYDNEKEVLGRVLYESDRQENTYQNFSEDNEAVPFPVGYPVEEKIFGGTKLETVKFGNLSEIKVD